MSDRMKKTLVPTGADIDSEEELAAAIKLLLGVQQNDTASAEAPAPQRPGHARRC
jgi:hypothetical protein